MCRMSRLHSLDIINEAFIPNIKDRSILHIDPVLIDYNAYMQ